jgi:hypothetical protein
METAGVPLPSSGLWEQAEPGWRTAADMQRVEAWRAETNVRREGIGSPDALRTSVNYWMLPAVTQTGKAMCSRSERSTAICHASVPPMENPLR